MSAQPCEIFFFSKFTERRKVKILEYSSRLKRSSSTAEFKVGFYVSSSLINWNANSTVMSLFKPRKQLQWGMQNSTQYYLLHISFSIWATLMSNNNMAYKSSGSIDYVKKKLVVFILGSPNEKLAKSDQPVYFSNFNFPWAKDTVNGIKTRWVCLAQQIFPASNWEFWL